MKLSDFPEGSAACPGCGSVHFWPCVSCLREIEDAEPAKYTNPDKHGGPVGEIEHDHDCIKRRVPAAACDCAEVQA